MDLSKGNILRVLSEEHGNILRDRLHQDWDLLYNQVFAIIDEKRVKEHKHFVICISVQDIESNDISIENLDEKIRALIQESFSHNIMTIDTDINILEKNNIELKIEFICDMSKSSPDDVIIFYHEENISKPYSFDVIFEGAFIETTGIFRNPEEAYKYRELYSMSDIDTIFEKYQSHLCLDSSRNQFFLKTSEKHPTIKQEKNILRNSPESTFRVHFKDYLSIHTRMEVIDELTIINNKKIDIFLEEASQFILIEIKWMGRSIQRDGSEYTSDCKLDTAVDGIPQIFDYLGMAEIALKGKDFKGYLAIFDCRLNRTNDTDQILSKISELRKIQKYERIYINYYSRYQIFTVDDHLKVAYN